MSKGKSGEHLQSTAPRIHPAPAARVDADKTLEKSLPDNHFLLLKSSDAFSNYSTEADPGDRQVEDDINNNYRVKEGTASATLVDS